MRRHKAMWMLAVAAMIACAYVAYAQEKDAAKGAALQIEGSTTVGPSVDAFAEVFMKDHPNVKVTVKATGSGDGAAALIDGRCDIASMSRFMKPEEFAKAVEKKVLPCCTTIAMDGVCVIVHPSNPVSALTIEQVRDIYLGKITNWKEVGGQDAKIVCISRDTSSGTFEVFEEKVMQKQKMGEGVETVNSNPQAHARVNSTANAIAYVGLGFLDDKVKAVKVENVMPSKATVVNGEYPIARPLFLFTNGFPKPGSTTYAFVTFYLSEKGQQLIEAKGFVPLTKY